MSDSYSLTAYTKNEKENNKVIYYGLNYQESTYERLKMNVGINGAMQLSPFQECNLFYNEVNNNRIYGSTIDGAQQIIIKKSDQKV